MNLEKDFTTFYAYGQSKLAQVMFTLELEKRLRGCYKFGFDKILNEW